ncbi:MAG: transcriptional regulator [Victivallaceae bacterium]|nr:transcriptional regulator [Victivallaceae bacterium]
MQTILTRAFGCELKAVLKKAGIRQKVLAHHLKMTPSAISQTVSGILVPSRENFDQIAILVGDKADVSTLRDLWKRIRLGEKEIRSAFNRALLQFRQRRRLSVVKLANLSGIPASRLRKLESDPEAFPDASEAEKLALILQCDFGSYAASRGDQDEPYTPRVTPILEVADRAAELPLIDGEMLLLYSGKESLADFAAGNALEKVRCGALNRGAVCAVVLDAAAMDFAAPGKLLVFLGEEFMMNISSLSITEIDGELLFLPTAQSVRCQKACWRLPVAEVVYQPEKFLQ